MEQPSFTPAADLPIGTRVRIFDYQPAHPYLTFASREGRVIAKDDTPGWYLIQLDQPATYSDALGTQETSEIYELGDHLDVLS